MKKLNLEKIPFQREKFLSIEKVFNELLEELAKQNIIELEKDDDNILQEEKGEENMGSLN